MISILILGHKRSYLQGRTLNILDVTTKHPLLNVSLHGQASLSRMLPLDVLTIITNIFLVSRQKNDTLLDYDPKTIKSTASINCWIYTGKLQNIKTWIYYNNECYIWWILIVSHNPIHVLPKKQHQPLRLILIWKYNNMDNDLQGQ